MDIREAAVVFEAVKLSIKQDKTGYILHLSVHPNDAPDSLLRDWVGTRYQVALVRLTDDNQPDPPEDVKKNKNAVASAHLLCREGKFWGWMAEHPDFTGMGITNEQECKEALYQVLSITSRAMLATDRAARDRFLELRDQFRADMGGSNEPG